MKPIRVSNIPDAAAAVNRQANSITSAARQKNAATDELVNAMEIVSAIVEENTCKGAGKRSRSKLATLILHRQEK